MTDLIKIVQLDKLQFNLAIEIFAAAFNRPTELAAESLNSVFAVYPQNWLIKQNRSLITGLASFATG